MDMVLKQEAVGLSFTIGKAKSSSLLQFHSIVLKYEDRNVVVRLLVCVFPGLHHKGAPVFSMAITRFFCLVDTVYCKSRPLPQGKDK